MIFDGRQIIKHHHMHPGVKENQMMQEAEKIVSIFGLKITFGNGTITNVL